jgi:hypothetical protein
VEESSDGLDVPPRVAASIAALCVAKLVDGRISIPEQLLRGECRTDGTASDDANGPEKEATGTSEACLRNATSPIADLEPQSINDREHSHGDVAHIDDCPMPVAAL